MKLHPLVALGVGAVLLSTTLTGCGARTAHSAESQPSGASQVCSPGITDTSIKLGASLAQSGVLAVYAAQAKGIQDYFSDINAAGGLPMGDGKTRTVEMVAYDDGYDPARTVTNVQKLVEQDEVFALAPVLGTANVLAVKDYVGEQGVPLILGGTGTPELESEPYNPWVKGVMAAYNFEGAYWADYIASHFKAAKVGFLYPTSGFGVDVHAAFVEAIKGTDIQLVDVAYETGADLTSQTVDMSKMDLDVWFTMPSGTQATQILTKAKELDWVPPLTILTPGSTAKSLITPTGWTEADNLYSYSWYKDVTTPDTSDPGIKEWIDFADKYGYDPENSIEAQGLFFAKMVEQVLKGMKGCTRQDFMDSYNSIEDFSTGLELAPITVEDDFPFVWTKVKQTKWNGDGWTYGDTIDVYSVIGK
ncbi:ABC transporter substrate-binding protein [Microbacterium sp. BWT-B31]|uniref:ABC transporter substrate-binding protein n=1 Tax=Microbacterium sp. BWT-B31 TaxID=3232072 RepID=UPI003527A468